MASRSSDRWWKTDDNHGAQVQFRSSRHMLDIRGLTIGNWVSYRLETLNYGLLEFIYLGLRFFDKRETAPLFLGPAYDVVLLEVDFENPLPFAKPELELSEAEQRLEFDLVRRLN
ncbi:MAG: hypothetical protein M2R45_00336 [Verrucomicrobia subdivision 3 bacterium]|nr:hypothetical protein [Limisphaerales bacterium]